MLVVGFPFGVGLGVDCWVGQRVIGLGFVLIGNVFRCCLRDLRFSYVQCGVCVLIILVVVRYVFYVFLFLGLLELGEL